MITYPLSCGNFSIFASNRSSLSPFFSYLQLGKHGLFLFQKNCSHTPSAVVISPLLVAKKYKKKRFYIGHDIFAGSLAYLPQNVRLCRHFFRIFSSAFKTFPIDLKSAQPVFFLVQDSLTDHVHDFPDRKVLKKQIIDIAI